MIRARYMIDLLMAHASANAYRTGAGAPGGGVDILAAVL